MQSAQEFLAEFTVDNLPNLDTVVLGALELCDSVTAPSLKIDFLRPLVVGSVNALSTGKIIFRDKYAVYSDESNFEELLENEQIDGVVVVSASGSKHSVDVVKKLQEKNREVILITNNPAAKAGEFVNEVVLFPKNREPYTYNTSTYLSMVLSETGESAADLKDFLEKRVEPSLLRNFSSYSAFTFIVPPQFSLVREMFRTKFDELFGPYIIGRIFTSEEIKHAKTVVSSGDELFVSFGEPNEYFGLPKNRLKLPLPENVDYGAILAIGYYLIGKIQKDHPPYFKNNIVEYTEKISKIFGQEIKPIVE